MTEQHSLTVDDGVRIYADWLLERDTESFAEYCIRRLGYAPEISGPGAESFNKAIRFGQNTKTSPTTTTTATTTGGQLMFDYKQLCIELLRVHDNAPNIGDFIDTGAYGYFELIRATLKADAIQEANPLKES